MSIAGGVHNALQEGRRMGCDVVQVFTRNNRQWAMLAITADDAKRFREAQRETGIDWAVAHANYLINMASPDPDLFKRSCNAVVHEVRSAERLGLTGVVIHPGCHMGAGVEKGIARVVRCLNTVHRRCSKARVPILLETTAGQGTALGGRLEELAEIITRCKSPERLGTCLDTCHVFAAGYDLRTPRAAKATLKDFDRTVGLETLRVLHFNDSVGELGSHRDRHAHIGQGKLGTRAFRYLLNDSGLLEDRPAILETPKGYRGHLHYDQINLRKLRRLIARR